MIHNPPAQRGQSAVYTNPNSQIVSTYPQQYGNVINQQPPPVTTYPQQYGNVINQQPPSVSDANISENFYSRSSLGLGISQICIGVLVIVVNIVWYETSYFSVIFAMSPGTWAGIFFIITGSLGTAAGVLKMKCMVTAFMVNSILALCFPLPWLFFNSLLNIGSDEAMQWYTDNIDATAAQDQYNYEVGQAMVYTMMALSVLELVVGIISIVVCSHAVCRCVSSQGHVLSNQPPGYGYTRIEQQQSLVI